MNKLATVTAVLAVLGAIASQSPAMAAMGQCFDAYGRPYGPPHNTDNPPYGMICQAYRIGGHCTHVQPGWAESNCGIGPRYRGHYDYRPQYNYKRGYDYDYDYRARRRQERDDARREYLNKYYPKSFAPGYQYDLRTTPPPSTAR